jgi:L,D-peptidoglycan transpeptidase YkuD (ErfK/YbiS/YcfS/YnhG family)
MPVTTRVLALVLAAAAAGAVAGCAGPAGAQVRARPAPVPVRAGSPPPATPMAARLPQRPPGLGPRTLAEVPAGAREVVVVTGQGKDSPDSHVVLYRLTAAGWRAGARWPAHNALHGWTRHHHAGDLRSPIGVFTLTDAGGRLPNPGTALPYDHSRGFTIGGTGLRGEPLAGSFDYVLAINYNRRPGTTPLDWTRPEGAAAGGGIWFHVDHGGPTHACVSLSRPHMKALLRALAPSRHPVVVMGDAASLAR